MLLTIALLVLIGGLSAIIGVNRGQWRRYYYRSNNGLLSVLEHGLLHNIG